MYTVLHTGVKQIILFLNYYPLIDPQHNTCIYVTQMKLQAAQLKRYFNGKFIPMIHPCTCILIILACKVGFVGPEMYGG